MKFSKRHWKGKSLDPVGRVRCNNIRQISPTTWARPRM